MNTKFLNFSIMYQTHVFKQMLRLIWHTKERRIKMEPDRTLKSKCLCDILYTVML